MFYLVEKKVGYYGYVLDTNDGIVERVSMRTFNKIIQKIEIKGAGVDLNTSTPCVPSCNTIPVANVSGACILCLNEIFTHNNHGNADTRFAGKAILRGNAGVVALKNLLSNGAVKLKSDNALSGEVSDLFEVSIIFSAKYFSQLPALYLTDYLIFNYINDDVEPYKSVNTRIPFPYFAPKGLTSYVSMFMPLKFSDKEMSYWELREYLLGRFKVIQG